MPGRKALDKGHLETAVSSLMIQVKFKPRLEFNYSLQNVETYRLLHLAFFAKSVQQLQPHPLIGKCTMNIIKIYLLELIMYFAFSVEHIGHIVS